MRRRRKTNENSTGDWLTTYSDMVTLLLCFFVLLFSFSEIDAQRFRSIMSSFQGGTGVLTGSTQYDLEEIMDDPEESIEADLEDLKLLLEEYADSVGLGTEIILSIEERGLIVRFMDKVLFDSGKANLRKESVEIIDSIGEILAMEEFENKSIKVEGHTDTVPTGRHSEFPTNWELSSARATTVLRFLVEQKGIDGDRISSSGYSYYKPIAPNDTAENKQKNRRVDIVILRTSYGEIEP